VEVTGAPVVFDIETGDAKGDQRFTDPVGFFRIGGAAVAGAGYVDTTDPRALSALVASAPLGIGHNIISFDAPVLDAAGGQLDLLAMTRRRQLMDTMITEAVLDPPESDDAPNAVGRAMARYGLNATCERRGLPGKTDHLPELAKEFGGFDRIPLTDARYRSYLRGDVDATGVLAAVQLPAAASNDYLWREHRVHAILTLMGVPGVMVDMPLLQQRYWRTAGRKATLARTLIKRYGLPLVKADGKRAESPQATKEGKAVLYRTFLELGVRPEDFPRTPKREPSFGGDGMAELGGRYGGAVAQLAEVVADLAGQRTVYGTALEHTRADGAVHPKITTYQASGRGSVTEPGLTVFGKRGGRVVERQVFRAREGHVLLAADLAQIDMRAIAGLSQDPDYIAVFNDPGRDLHSEIAAALWGGPIIGNPLREKAKPMGHGSNYGMGPEKLAANAGVTEAEAIKFQQMVDRMFPGKARWTEHVRNLARGGVLDNGFGRIMRCNPRRAHTQGPALMGQGAARDLTMECALRLPDEVARMLRIWVHDEFVFEVPEGDVAEVSAVIEAATAFEWAPPYGSIPVQIKAEVSGYGRSWADCYRK
jgi:DNA polymerase-1